MVQSLRHIEECVRGTNYDAPRHPGEKYQKVVDCVLRKILIGRNLLLVRVGGDKADTRWLFIYQDFH